MFYRSSDLRLANRNVVACLRQNGGVITTKYLKIYFMLEDTLVKAGILSLSSSLVCISVNRKVGSAVVRNRLKRILRVAFEHSFKLYRVYILVTFRNSVILSSGLKTNKGPKLVTPKLLLEDLRYALRCV